MRTAERRERTHDAGRAAELLALLFLAAKGYRILARRYIVKGGELDLVVRRGAVVAFVEVKARPSRDLAADAITPAKHRRIERAAAVWLTRNPWALALTLRGDAFLVTPRAWPRHVTDAFELRVG